MTPDDVAFLKGWVFAWGIAFGISLLVFAPGSIPLSPESVCIIIGFIFIVSAMFVVWVCN